MKKQSAAVVEDVFAVVRGIYHCRNGAAAVKLAYQERQKMVGVSYAVVVGIEQLLAVRRLGFACVVGCEHSLVRPVTLAVVKVRAVCMQHNQLLFTLLVDDVVYGLDHLVVVHVVAFRLLFDKFPFVSLFAEDVNKRVVGALVGYERGVETCLAERRYYAFFAVNAAVVVG